MLESEIIVIGGGPAGSSAATFLAMKGRSVLLFEKESFPRYHIGESLMPYTYFPLERLGVIEQMKASHFTKKYSVQFVSPSGDASHPFYFFKHFDHPAAVTWQVVRSEFDQMLLDNARAKGVTVELGTAVTRLLVEDERVVGVEVRDRAGVVREVRARVVIDATGRDTLSVSQFRWRVADRNLDRFALWTYYKGALRDPGIDAGATTVAYLPDRGWFWYIPLPDEGISCRCHMDMDRCGQPWVRPAEPSAVSSG